MKTQQQWNRFLLAHAKEGAGGRINAIRKLYMGYLFPRGFRIISQLPQESKLEFEQLVELRMCFAQLRAYVDNMFDSINAESVRWKKKLKYWKNLDANRILTTLYKLLVVNYGRGPLKETIEYLDKRSYKNLGKGPIEIECASLEERRDFLHKHQLTSDDDFYLREEYRRNTIEKKIISDKSCWYYDYNVGCLFTFSLKGGQFYGLDNPTRPTAEDLCKLRAIRPLFNHFLYLLLKISTPARLIHLAKEVQNYSKLVDGLIDVVEDVARKRSQTAATKIQRAYMRRCYYNMGFVKRQRLGNWNKE